MLLLKAFTEAMAVQNICQEVIFSPQQVPITEKTSPAQVVDEFFGSLTSVRVRKTNL
jgi:hypothetical protein